MIKHLICLIHKWIHHIQSTDCQDVADTKRYPPFFLEKRKASGRVTEKETEGPVFTLAEWAACEPHGNGQLTSDGEKAPPWLTGPGFWSSAQSVCFSMCLAPPGWPYQTKQIREIRRKMVAIPGNTEGEPSLRVKGCMWHGKTGPLVSCPLNSYTL